MNGEGGRWRGGALTVSAKSGWRARGFADGNQGRPKRELHSLAVEHMDAYNEGYRVGKRERANGNVKEP